MSATIHPKEFLKADVNALAAATRTDPNACTGLAGLDLQNQDFTPFRSAPSVRKLVVLITDVAPGGFCNLEHINHAQQYAQDAYRNRIKINAIQVGSDASGEAVMRYYYQTSCGWFSQLPADGGSGAEVLAAILKMVNQPGYCEFP